MNPRQKARDLIELAADDRTPEKERVAAAWKAVELIRKYDLLSSPLDGFLGGMLASSNEDIQAVGTVLEAITDPKLVAGIKTIAGRIKRRKKR